MAYVLIVTECLDGVAVEGGGAAGTEPRTILDPQDREIYRQRFEDLDVQKVIRAANNMRRSGAKRLTRRRAASVDGEA